MHLNLLDKETKEILNQFIKEIKILNEHLSDFKIMLAPFLGWKIKEKGEK